MHCGIASNRPTVVCTICLIKSTGVNRETTTEKDTDQPRQTNSTYPGHSAGLQGWVPLPLCTHPCTIFCYFLRVCTHPANDFFYVCTCSTCAYLTRELPRLGGVTPCLPACLVFVVVVRPPFYFFIYVVTTGLGDHPNHPSCRCHAFERRGHVYAAGDRAGLA